MKDFLRHVPPDIAPHIKRLQFAPEDPILLAGEENHHIYFVESGHVKGYMQTADGTAASVCLFDENSLFGEIEIFCQNLNTIGITAVGRCTVCRLHRRYFLQWMEGDFAFTCAVIRQLAQKLQQNSMVRENLTLLTVQQRVLRRLAAWHARGQLPYLTKEMLCAEASAPLRSVNRALAACARQGIAAWAQKRFVVLDEAALHAAAEG